MNSDVRVVVHVVGILNSLLSPEDPYFLVSDTYQAKHRNYRCSVTEIQNFLKAVIN